MDSLLINLMRQADAINEADANTTYLGFCAKNTNAINQAGWSICRILKTGNTTTIMWANGQRHTYNLIFDNATNYTYEFRKF